VLILIALALLAAAHYLLFALDSDLSKLPPDILHSPDAILFVATFVGVFVLALLLRSELKQASIANHENNNRKPANRGRNLSNVHYQR